MILQNFNSMFKVAEGLTKALLEEPKEISFHYNEVTETSFCLVFFDSVIYKINEILEVSVILRPESEDKE